MLLALALGAASAAGHTASSAGTREVVRLQGNRLSAPTPVAAQRLVNLVVLGQPLPFAAADWRVFGFGEARAAEAAADPRELTLQGDRSQLHRIASARPEQRITILAERRPGSAELFLLAVDLCPDH
ncbi:MAG: hypothetical protein AB7V27_00510 [Candidatus Binatia bacterium]